MCRVCGHWKHNCSVALTTEVRMSTSSSDDDDFLMRRLMRKKKDVIGFTLLIKIVVYGNFKIAQELRSEEEKFIE